TSPRRRNGSHGRKHRLNGVLYALWDIHKGSNANTAAEPEGVTPRSRDWRHALQEGRGEDTLPASSFPILPFEEVGSPRRQPLAPAGGFPVRACSGQEAGGMVPPPPACLSGRPAGSGGRRPGERWVTEREEA